MVAGSVCSVDLVLTLRRLVARHGIHQRRRVRLLHLAEGQDAKENELILNVDAGAPGAQMNLQMTTMLNNYLVDWGHGCCQLR